MNILDRTLIEKAGHEHGWEIPSADGDAVRLASARHRAAVRIAQTLDGWALDVAGSHLAQELRRSFPNLAASGTCFQLPSDLAFMARVLQRAAELSFALPNQAATDYEALAREALAKTGPVSTEVERLVRQRVGQDVFRKALLDYWSGACAVTGIAVPELLRASHAKPWTDCATDAERLDAYNGFLLTANLDALFDRGLITFDPTGLLTCSPYISPDSRTALGLDHPLRLRWLAPEHTPYLDYHRNLIFQSC